MLPAALIQYTDALAASRVREILNGKSIPSYLLPERVKSSCLNISISANTDLNIKPGSHGSRDYTIPYIPVNYSAVGSTLQPAVGADGREEEAESNVLLASIENVQYDDTVDTLHYVFSEYGPVQKIAIFVNNGGTQALIQYRDVITAEAAKKASEGHCIYPGRHCRIHLSYSRHTDLCIKQDSDKSRDYTTWGVLQAIPQSAGVPATSAVWQGNPETSESYGPPGMPAQYQSMNWNQNPGNTGYPPVGYPGQMYLPGGFSAPPPHHHEMHSSLQTPPAHHGNQQRPTDGCFKCGAPNHIARDCDQDAEQKAKGPNYVLKDENTWRSVNNRRSYDLVLDDDAACQNRRKTQKVDDWRSELQTCVDRDRNSRNSQERAQSDKKGSKQSKEGDLGRGVRRQMTTPITTDLVIEALAGTATVTTASTAGMT